MRLPLFRNESGYTYRHQEDAGDRRRLVDRNGEARRRACVRLRDDLTPVFEFFRRDRQFRGVSRHTPEECCSCSTVVRDI